MCTEGFGLRNRSIQSLCDRGMMLELWGVFAYEVRKVRRPGCPPDSHRLSHFGGDEACPAQPRRAAFCADDDDRRMQQHD